MKKIYYSNYDMSCFREQVRQLLSFKNKAFPDYYSIAKEQSQ